MTILSDYIDRLVAAGMAYSEATQIVAEIFAAGAANVSAKSSNAVRQKRYRENKKRNETVTNRNGVTLDETVTNRNETVTNRNDVTPPSLSIEKKDKNKEERKRERRASQLPDDWRPDEGRWMAACEALGGEEATQRELRKFRNHALEKGRVAKNWNAAWDNWVDRAVEWRPRQVSPEAPAKPLTEFQRKQAEANDIASQLRSYRTRNGSGGGPDRPLSHDPGQRPEEIRGGNGPVVLALPRASDRGGG